MSVMSPKTATRLSPKQRRNTIRDNILFCNYEELAKMCGVTKRTIIRDVNAWKAEGGWNEFLIKEFFHHYSKERISNPEKALDRIIMLMTKTKEPELPFQIDEIRLKWQEDESNTSDKVQAT